MIEWKLSQPDALAGSSVVLPNPLLPASELAIDEATGDLAIPVRLIYGADAIAQRIRSRFKFFLGEWFLDTRQGVPYFQYVFIQRPNATLIQNVFRQVLITTPGVASVSSFSLSVDVPTRTGTADFKCKLTDGTTLAFQNEPFIVGNQ